MNIKQKFKKKYKGSYKKGSYKRFLQNFGIKWQLISFYFDKLRAWKNSITLRIVQNNVFCTLTNRYRNNILKNISAGILKTHVSKKTLKFTTKTIIRAFFKIIKNFLKRELIITIIGPIKFRKKILGQCKEYIKKKNKNVIFNIKNKKCFNGCRPPKKKRKKRKFKRYFK